MLNFRNLRDTIDGFKKSPKIRFTLLIIAGIFIMLVVIESGLNLWVRSILRQRFVSGGGAGYRLEARVGWMNLWDLVKGKVKFIRLSGSNCRVSDLRYRTLRVDNVGLDFDMGRLLREKQLYLERIGRTKVQGVVTQEALTEYLRHKYPEFEPEVYLIPKQIQLSGLVKLFGSPTSVRVNGGLEAAGPKTLRFFPENFMIANRNVPPDLLKFISTQLPLTFDVMENWPLQIAGLRLRDRELEIELKEIGE